MPSGPAALAPAAARPASPRASRPQRFRLVHQHDGDVVLDAVHQPAGLADDLLPVLAELQLALALRAGQDLLELRRDGHGRQISRKTRELPEAGVSAEGLVRPGPGHGRSGRAVEESEAQHVAADEAPERPGRDLPRSRARSPGEEHARRLLAVAFHLGETILQGVVRVMENGRVEAGDGPLDDQLLVDRPLRIIPAGLASEEAHVAVGPEASVAE